MPVSILKKVKNTCDKPSLFPTTASTKQPPCEPGIVDAEKKELGGCTTNSTNDSNNNFFLSNTQTQTQTAMIAVRKKIKRRPQSLYNVFFMGERKKILHEATLYIRKEMEGADYKSLTVQEKEERMQKLEVTPERLVQLIEKRWVCADKSLLNSYYKLVDVEKKRVEHLTVVKKAATSSGRAEIEIQQPENVVQQKVQQNNQPSTEAAVVVGTRFSASSNPQHYFVEPPSSSSNDHSTIKSCTYGNMNVAGNPPHPPHQQHQQHHQQQQQQQLVYTPTNHQGVIAQQAYANTTTPTPAPVRQITYHHPYSNGNSVVNHHHGQYQGSQTNYYNPRHDEHEPPPQNNYGGGGGNAGNSYTEVVHHYPTTTSQAGQGQGQGQVSSGSGHTQFANAQGNNQFVFGSGGQQQQQQSYYTTTTEMTHYPNHNQGNNYYHGGAPYSPPNDHGLLASAGQQQQQPLSSTTMQYNSSAPPPPGGGGNLNSYNNSNNNNNTSAIYGTNNTPQHGVNAQGYTTTEYYVYEPSSAAHGQNHSQY